MYRSCYPETWVSEHKGLLTYVFLSVFQIVINNYRSIIFPEKTVVFLVLELAPAGLEKLQRAKFKAEIKNNI